MTFAPGVVATELRAQGLEADCTEVTAADPAGYDAVVLGSAVYTGRIPQDPHGMVETAMARRTPAELRDSRDRDAVRDWARQVAAEPA